MNTSLVVDRSRRFFLGRVPIDRVTMREAIAAIVRMVDSREGGAVFTPNVDHVVLASANTRLRLAYADVDLSVADGAPVLWASQLVGCPVPEKVSGSDLTPALLRVAEMRRLRIFLLGGANGVAKLAAEKLLEQYPLLRIAGTVSPPIDMTEPRSKRAGLIRRIRDCAPDIVLVGLGCPKQELWIHEAREALRPAVLLGVGASIDFAAGLQSRAPRWMSRVGLEWLYRLAKEPRRLWRRYLLRDPAFVGILLREFFSRRLALGGPRL